MTNTMDYDKAIDLIPCKKSMREALMSNGLYPPALHAGILTVDYMKGIRDGKIWCIKYIDVRLRPCPQRPCKEFIVKAIFEIIREV